MRRFRCLLFIVVAVLALFATVGCDPEEPELEATAVPTYNPTSTSDLSAPSPTPSLAPTVSPKISQGLGVSRHELEALFSQPEWGFSFWHVAGEGQHEPRSVGEIEGVETFTLLLIGPPENLYEVRTAFTLDFDQPDASLGITLYLVELLASVLPTWSNSDEWLADAMDALAEGVEEVETTHGTAVVRVNLGGSIDAPILDMTIQSQRAAITSTPSGTVTVPVQPLGSTLDDPPTTTPATVIPTPQPTPTQAPTPTPTPTREPTPTPEPKPVAIGTTVAAGGSSYTLNEVRDPAPPGIFGVDEGKRLIALDITQVGISDDGDDFNALYFAVQDSDGYVYSPGLAGADVEPQFGYGELATGQIVRGWVVFELPESARLMSVMVEADVFGSRITITEFTQGQAGDVASQTLPPVPVPPSSPVAIGTTVAAGGSSYTLNEVRDPAPAGIFGVDEGKRLIALDITQVGTSDDGDDFNALYFAVQDSDGYVYSPGLADADVEPQFGYGELAAGQIVRGWVVFELPEWARLMSVMVEAEVLGPRTTISDLSNPMSRNGAPTPTPIAETEVISAMQMKVTDSSGNRISTMEQWKPLVRPAHWKEGRSAYSIADFILNRQGATYMESSISSVLSQPIRLEQGTPEFAAKFDGYSGPARLDIGISGQAGAQQNLFVGVEAKVDEPFGSETVCERYTKAIEYLSSNPRSKAAARVRELLSLYLGDTDEPCESRFADVGYQLLTAAAGTVAQQKDVSVFYVVVFKSGEFDEVKGEENQLDYENFITLVGGERLMRDHEESLAHEITLNGRQLICIYEYFSAEA